MASNETPLPISAEGEAAWLKVVRQHVESLRFGQVHLVVHDGRVTQIERLEKLRIADREDRPVR